MSVLQAQDVLVTFKNANVEKKIDAVTNLKSFIKKNDVELEAVPILFDAIKQGLISSNHNFSQASLHCLANLIKRVSIQDSSRLKSVTANIMPVIVDRLGDVKDRSREIAMNSLVEFWKANGAEVERSVKELGFTSKNWRIREQSMQWLVNVYRSQNNFSFRSFTPLMMKILEDANETVRDNAKEVVIELFQNAPGHAKSDLKKLLQAHHVRKTTQQHILSKLGLVDQVPASELGSSSTDEQSIAVSNPQFQSSRPQSQVGFHRPPIKERAISSAPQSVTGSISTTTLSNLPGAEMENLEAALIASKGDLEITMNEMMPCFEDRESEHNWGLREKNIMKLRALLRGNAYREYPQTYIEGIKNLQAGIIKGMLSLRTTVCLAACQLVKDLSIVTGTAIDPFVENFLATFVQLSCGNKKIVNQASQVAVAVIIFNSSYHPRLVNQVWSAVQDKNTNPRIFAPGWLKVLLETHEESKIHIEHGTGIETIEKCFKKGLTDSNPTARQGMRETFWSFWKIWPERANLIMKGLDVSGRKGLEKANPNAGGMMAAVLTGKTNVDDIGQTPVAISRPQTTQRISVKSLVAEQRKKTAIEIREKGDPPVPGLGAGAQRQGLGLPQRPIGGLTGIKKLENVSNLQRPPSASSNGTKTTKTGSPPRKAFGASPPVSPNRMITTTVPSSRQSPLHHNTGSGGNTGVPSAIPRSAARTFQRLTVLEQLINADPNIRSEGIVVIACLLAKRDPPGYAPGQRLPTLPPLDTLAPTLSKLLNDPVPEVVHHLLAPEVIPEIAKILTIDQIIPRMLLLSESEDEESIKNISASLPTLKGLLTDAEAAEMLTRQLLNLGVTGVVPKKPSNGLGTFSTTQKRKIIHGIFLWMIALVDKHNAAVAKDEPGNEYFLDEANYKQYIHRLVLMIPRTQTTSQNFIPLTIVLKVLREINSKVFDKVLGTFEKASVIELKKAWGQTVDDTFQQEGPPGFEEKVVTVHEVLGDVKVGGLTTVSGMAGNSPAGSTRHRRLGSGSTPPISPIPRGEFEDYLENANGTSRLVTTPSVTEHTAVDEDLTMIPMPLVTKGVGSSGSNKENDKQTPETMHKNLEPTKNISGRTMKDDGVYQDERSRTVGTERVNKQNSNARSILPKSLAGFAGVLEKYLPSETPLPQDIADQQKLLNNLINRLETRQMDAPGFHSLSRLCKQSHIELHRPGTDEDAMHLWQGGNKFNELLRSLLGYLMSDDFAVSNEKMVQLKTQAFDGGLKPLIRHQTPYFIGHESSIIKILLNLRSQGDFQMHHTVDDALMEFVGVVDAELAINIILDYDNAYVHREAGIIPHTPSVVLTMKSLASLVRRLTRSMLEVNLERLGPLVVTAMYDPDTEMRRQGVAVAVSLYMILGDKNAVFKALKGIEAEASKVNLLHYYFAHARKQSQEST